MDSSAEASATVCKPQKLEPVGCPSVIAVTSADQPSQQPHPERISSDVDSSGETRTAGETQIASGDQPSEQTSRERISSDVDGPEETHAAEAQIASTDQPTAQASPEHVSSDVDGSGETRAAEAQVASGDQPNQQTSPERISSDIVSPGEMHAAEAQVASGSESGEQTPPERISSDAGSSEEIRATEAQSAAPMALARNDIVVPVALQAAKEPQATSSQLRTDKLAHVRKSKSPMPRRRRLVRDYPSLRIGASTPMFDPVRYSYN
jgi:hypothetical protein